MRWPVQAIAIDGAVFPGAGRIVETIDRDFQPAAICGASIVPASPPRDTEGAGEKRQVVAAMRAGRRRNPAQAQQIHASVVPCRARLWSIEKWIDYCIGSGLFRRNCFATCREPVRTGPVVTCGRGGIGRRAALRSLWGNPWKFESSRPHHNSLKSLVGQIVDRKSCGLLSLKRALQTTTLPVFLARTRDCDRLSLVPFLRMSGLLEARGWR